MQAGLRDRRKRLGIVLASAAVLAVGGSVPLAYAGGGDGDHGGRNDLRASLTGAKEVPGPGDPDGRGTARVSLKGNRICFDLSWRISMLRPPPTSTSVPEETRDPLWWVYSAFQHRASAPRSRPWADALMPTERWLPPSDATRATTTSTSTTWPTRPEQSGDNFTSRGTTSGRPSLTEPPTSTPTGPNTSSATGGGHLQPAQPSRRALEQAGPRRTAGCSADCPDPARR